MAFSQTCVFRHAFLWPSFNYSSLCFLFWWSFSTCHPTCPFLSWTFFFAFRLTLFTTLSSYLLFEHVVKHYTYDLVLSHLLQLFTPHTFAMFFLCAGPCLSGAELLFWPFWASSDNLFLTMFFSFSCTCFLTFSSFSGTFCFHLSAPLTISSSL